MQRYLEHVGQKKKVLWPQRVHVPLLPRTGKPCHSLLRVSLTGSYLLVDDHCCRCEGGVWPVLIALLIGYLSCSNELRE